MDKAKHERASHSLTRCGICANRTTGATSVARRKTENCVNIARLRTLTPLKHNLEYVRPHREAQAKLQSMIVLAQRYRSHDTGPSKPLDRDVADVVLNFAILSCLFSIPWLTGHFYYVPLVFLALIPPLNRVVGPVFNQLWDILQGRLRNAWGGYRTAHFHRDMAAGEDSEDTDAFYQWMDSSQSSQRADRNADAAGDSTRKASPNQNSEYNQTDINIYKSASRTSRYQARSNSRRKKQTRPPPLLLRMLFSVFPFMQFWGGFL